MKEVLEAMEREAQSQLQTAAEMQSVEAVRLRLLGKKGSLTDLLKTLGGLPPQERPAAGALINGARERIEAAIEQKAAQLRASARTAQLSAEKVDVSAPAPKLPIGALHPLTQTQEKLMEIFTGMGFEVLDGPEVEWDRYNFEMLNIPKHHPARDMQDSFFFSDNIVLRTHTSPMQARTMERYTKESRKPPIRIVCPGRVYRVDEVDATHSPVFHQMEGLVVDEGITMADLKGTLGVFAREMYGEGTQTRFRPSYFPFTEPSAEVDVTCAACRGAGCRICKGTGWIEILGAGMVNPAVLRMCGIDPERYSGFAFGMGIDRVTNLKYNVTDMRLLFENDLRFLAQFL